MVCCCRKKILEYNFTLFLFLSLGFCDATQPGMHFSSERSTGLSTFKRSIKPFLEHTGVRKGKTKFEGLVNAYSNLWSAWKVPLTVRNYLTWNYFDTTWYTKLNRDAQPLTSVLPGGCAMHCPHLYLIYATSVRRWQESKLWKACQHQSAEQSHGKVKAILTFTLYRRHTMSYLI